MDSVKKAEELIEDGYTPKRKFSKRELPNYFDALDDTAAPVKRPGVTLHPAMGARSGERTKKRKP